MGISDTAGFVLYCVIYGSVRVVPAAGYGICGYGYGIDKIDPRVTCFKP